MLSTYFYGSNQQIDWQFGSNVRIRLRSILKIEQTFSCTFVLYKTEKKTIRIKIFDGLDKTSQN